MQFAVLGRSHHSTEVKQQLCMLQRLLRDILEIPEDHRIIIVPGSATGAIEAAICSLLGHSPIDLPVWELFGERWADDILNQLRLPNVQILESTPDMLIDTLGKVRKNSDVVTVWNGTTCGVRIPDASWIAPDRTGLIIADVASAVFGQALPWTSIDVAAFSWQKGLGGEAGLGTLLLSPAAVYRLENYHPPQGIPRVLQLQRLNHSTDITLNTPSLLCIADFLAALTWARSIGGGNALYARCYGNACVLHEWAEQSRWLCHTVSRPEIRSLTSVCLRLRDNNSQNNLQEENAILTKALFLLKEEGVAFDIASHRESPLGIRIWCGPTIDRQDLVILCDWLDWAFSTAHELTQKNKILHKNCSSSL
jgi:phosphoserine aminotransferase